MAFIPKKRLPSLQDLKGTLANSRLQLKDNALYQTINQLIDRISNSRDLIVGDTQEIDNSINNINTLINSNITNVTSLTGASYITKDNEQVDLPNSRQLLAGTNITFTDTVSSRTINSSAGSSALDHVVLSDGATPIPSAINDGFGNFIYIQYTP